MQKRLHEWNNVGSFFCKIRLKTESNPLMEHFYLNTTLISLINVKSGLPILKHSSLHKNNPPFTFIDFLDFPPSTLRLLHLCIQFFHVYWFFRFCTPSTFIPTSTVIRKMRAVIFFFLAGWSGTEIKCIGAWCSAQTAHNINYFYLV